MAPLSVAASPPWRARLATTALFFANGFGIGGWAAAIPLIKSKLALSDAQLSVALFAMAAGAILLMPSAGLLANRFGGAGRTLRGGAIGFSVSLGLIGLAPNLPLLAGLTFLLGAFSGLMDVRMNAHATLVERRWGAAIMSSFHAAWSCGGLAGASFGGSRSQEAPFWRSSSVRPRILAAQRPRPPRDAPSSGRRDGSPVSASSRCSAC
jgi:fucose permease